MHALAATLATLRCKPRSKRFRTGLTLRPDHRCVHTMVAKHIARHNEIVLSKSDGLRVVLYAYDRNCACKANCHLSSETGFTCCLTCTTCGRLRRLRRMMIQMTRNACQTGTPDLLIRMTMECTMIGQTDLNSETLAIRQPLQGLECGHKACSAVIVARVTAPLHTRHLCRRAQGL